MMLTVCVKKRREKGTLKIASIHRYKNSTIPLKIQRNTAIKYNSDNTSINRTEISRNQKWKEKQQYRYFKRRTSKVSHKKKTWTWLRKRSLKRETESLLISAQNNVIRTYNVKAKIDKAQQNIRCRLCGDRDETINLIISECSKIAQKE